MESRLSQTITFAHFPAIAGMILTHTWMLKFCADMRGAEFISTLTGTVLGKTCTYFFFFLAGYLMFANMRQWNTHQWVNKLHTRVRTLLVPYLLWNIIAVLLIVIKVHLSVDLYQAEYADYGLNFSTLLKCLGLWCYPADFVLWFIRDLMILCLLTPLVWLMVRYLGWWAVIIGLPVAMWIWFPGVPCFIAGACLAIKCDSVKVCHWLHNGKWAIVIWAILMGVVCSVPLPTLLSNALLTLAYITGAFAILAGAYDLLERWRQPQWLSKSAFFVYAFHGLFCTLTIMIVTHFIHPQSILSGILVVILDWIILVCVSLGVFLLGRHLMPGLTRILTGGR